MLDALPTRNAGLSHLSFLRAVDNYLVLGNCESENKNLYNLSSN